MPQEVEASLIYVANSEAARCLKTSFLGKCEQASVHSREQMTDQGKDTTDVHQGSKVHEAII